MREVQHYALPGPDPDTTRGLSIWRAPNSPDGPLPTLYAADGAIGIYMATAFLRPAIEAGRAPNIQIIGLDPHPEFRLQEYTQVGTPRYHAHERWVLEVVLPWAEQNARASSDLRAIAGFSNGGDFAIAMGAAHPELFCGVLAHSPVATQRFQLDRRAANTRWSVTAGRREFRGAAARILSLVVDQTRRNQAPVRSCLGSWGHDMEYWTELSPGGIAWLFGGEHGHSATQLELSSCRFIN